MKRIFTVWIVFVFSCCFSIISFGQNIQNILELHYAHITGLEIDSQGNNIVIGLVSDNYPLKDSLSIESQNIDIDIQDGQFFSQNYNIFVAKISPNNQLLWISRGFIQIFTTDLDETIDLDLHIQLDEFDNIYTLVSKTSNLDPSISRYIRWENDYYENANNLLFKLASNGSIAWSKAWRANNKKSRISNINNSNLLSVNKKGDILVTSNVKPDSDIKTIIDNDTIQVKHVDGAEVVDHIWDQAVLLLRFDDHGNFLYHRSIIRSPDISGHVTTNSIKINENKEIISIFEIKGIALFNTGESTPLHLAQKVYFINYDSLGENMTYYNSYDRVHSYDQLAISGDDIYINSYFNDPKHLPNDLINAHIYQHKVNSKGEILGADTLLSFNSTKGLLANSVSNVITNSKGESFFILGAYASPDNFVNPNFYPDTLTIYLDKKYVLGKNRKYHYFMVKVVNKKVQWSTLYATIDKFPWSNVDYADSRLLKLRTDNKGNIYFNSVYTSGVIIGGRQMPQLYRHSGAFVATMSDETFRFPAFNGKTFAETNNNCLFDGADYNLPSVLIKRNDGKLGISDKQGNYSLSFPEEGSFTLNSQLIDNTSFISNYIYDNCGTSKQITYRDGQITNPQNLNFGYKVKPCSYLAIDLTNERRRRCFMSSTTVEYKNQGFADAQNVEVKVEYPDYIFPVSSSPVWTRKEGNSYFFNVGSLAAGNTEKIVFQDSVICGIEAIRGLTQCVKATISPANSCEEWTDNENKYEISGRCVGGGIARYTIKNLSNISTDSIPYRLYANSKIFKEGKTLLPANGEVEIEVFTNGMTMRMELFPQNHDPISAFVEGCQVVIPYKTKAEAPNPVVSVAPVQESGVALPQNDGGERSETSCSEILDSYDPNDKQVVPFGLTKDNLIETTTELDYTIRFQNTGTIEAVNIVVLDTLSEFLDIETIRLGMVSHDYNFMIDGDADTRVLRFEFDNINLPDSNTNEPASHGFIKFKIKQKANNRIGTVIKNRAAIYFDFNSPIITNTISNKVAVLPLRANNLNLPIFNCSEANFELIANAGTDIETSNSTTTLAAQATQVFGNWTLVSGFGELENPSKNNSKVTGLLPFPTQLVWRVAVCGEAKQDTVVVQSTNTDYKFTIDFNQTESKLSVPTGKVTYQWYRDGILITGQTAQTLNLETLQNKVGVYTVVISSGSTSITSEPFTIDAVLSNNDFIVANYIKVYPNPTTSLLNVELNTILNVSEVSLINALGMELKKTKITNSDKITLDLENLSNGIYFVKIISQKGIFYKKVILKK